MLLRIDSGAYAVGIQDHTIQGGKMLRRSFFMIMFALLAAAPVAGEAAASSRGGAGLPPALLGVEWDLITMRLGGQPAEDVTGAKMTITFANDGTISGSGGCNIFGGSYIGDEAGGLTLPGPLISTMIACDPPISEREARYFLALPEVRGYSLDGAGRLQLRLAQADQQLTYVRAPGSMPQSGGGWGAQQLQRCLLYLIP